MKRTLSHSICCLFLIFIIPSSVIFACGIDYTFRAYLDKRFWQPFSKYEQGLGEALKPGQKNDSQTNNTCMEYIFAGMSTDPTSTSIQSIRNAYRNNDFADAKRMIEASKSMALSEKEREELLLVEAKIAMREGEKEPINNDRLREAQQKLIAFLKTSITPEWQSEARGWLARVYYLLDDYPSATKIYLDELRKDDTVHSRESMIASLRTLFPYNGSAARLSDHLEDYFDTPEHALFVVNIATNPVYDSEKEISQMSVVAQKCIIALQKHTELFNTGAMSDQLALALMRTSIYQGDTRAALSYASMITSTSKVIHNADYNWMIALAHFLQGEYQDSEAPLLRIVNSKQSTSRERNAASQGLIGVYQKTGSRVDQLHAAFLYQWISNSYEDEYGSYFNPSGTAYTGFMYWPLGGILFDLPYLLDVQLTDDELLQYLNKYSSTDALIQPWLALRKRTAIEIVKYELAVRYSRQERYHAAANIYEDLQARPRAKRMWELVKLHADSVNKSFTSQQLQEACYTYASYLEDHSTQIFFNDMIWNGLQTWTFLGTYNDQGLSQEERDLYKKQERRLKDEQEERWRAYKIFVTVMEQAGHSDLGRRAAEKAIESLRLISTNRFGRQNEINAAEMKLIKWLDIGKMTNQSKGNF
jgi:hypothetical protein